MEKPSVSLLNAVNNAPFPTASDLNEDFMLAEPGQTFKVFVSLKRPSSISWHSILSTVYHMHKACDIIP